ncbi:MULTISPECIES: hypothetical protein [unclassified Leptolyngbya]|nr:MULTISPECIES: hypothetical protein [unclassified Leptolyngbya]MBD1909633.1 hypothetical protein [Leptolyngbya sp. FACHB-8]MBD2157590.1 hypothetical protein [Leptolyngbya sp. FACHB-16]
MPRVKFLGTFPDGGRSIPSTPESLELPSKGMKVWVSVAAVADSSQT